MSYILDALKRADAERERGRVPGLHSQAAAAPDSQVMAPQARQVPFRAWRLLAGLLALALIGLVWFFSTPASETSTLSMPSAPVPSATATAPPAVVPDPLMPDAPATAPLPASAPPILAPREPSAPVAPASTARPAPVEREIHSFANLSTEQRAQLPQLNISGASYSENPAHRLLIVNGQIAQEGQEVAPGLVLERIGLNEAVLNQRGLRFRIGY